MVIRTEQACGLLKRLGANKGYRNDSELANRNCGKKLDRSNRSERRLHCIQTRIRCSA